MRIKDIEIISVYDLESFGYRQVQTSFKIEDFYTWRPQKYAELYFDSFKNYKLVCNFEKGRGIVLLNQRAEDILNLCNEERNLKNILEVLASREKFKFSDVWNWGKGRVSFQEFYGKIRFGKEILTLEDLIKICFLLNSIGLIKDFEAVNLNKRKISSLSKPPLEVYFYLADESSIGYSLSGENLQEITEENGIKAVDSIFDWAKKNNYEKILIKFFAGNQKEFFLLRKLVDYSKRKSMENIIGAEFFVFTNPELISRSFIKDLRQMRANLILPLDGTERTHDKHSQFLKRGLDILRKEKFSLEIIATITSLNLDDLGGLIKYLLGKKLNFIFGFIQKNSSIPKDLFPDNKKLAEAMLNACEVIEKKLPSYFLFPNILGRNFSLFGERKKNKTDLLLVYQKESLNIKEINFKPKQKEECFNCQFKELCQGSFPIMTSHFSFEDNSLLDYCEVYKVLIPQALKLEAKRLLKYKKY